MGLPARVHVAKQILCDAHFMALLSPSPGNEELGE